MIFRFFFINLKGVFWCANWNNTLTIFWKKVHVDRSGILFRSLINNSKQLWLFVLFFVCLFICLDICLCFPYFSGQVASLVPSSCGMLYFHIFKVIYDKHLSKINFLVPLFPNFEFKKNFSSYFFHNYAKDIASFKIIFSFSCSKIC